jgi:aminomethyltransferase
VPGKAQYSCLPNERGGIIDDLIVYMLEPDHYMIVVNASTAPNDWAWFTKRSEGFNVTLRNDSDDVALLAIQGKKAQEILQKMTDVDLSTIEYYHFARGTVAGVDMIISRTGYTGEPGFEIYFPAEQSVAGKVWDALFETGKPYGLAPIGLGARDTLRLEMGYCLYGSDIDETTNPLEAGLGWITKLKKSTPCLAFPAIAEAKERGLTRKLVGLLSEEKGAIMRHGHKIYDDAGYEIGVVTSGNISPMLNKAIGLGYVPTASSKEGSEVMVELRPGKRVKASVVKPPFVKPEVKA